MLEITNVITVRDTGVVAVKGSKAPSEVYAGGLDALRAYWGKEIARRWDYNGKAFEVNFDAIGFQHADLLPDATGFMVMQNVYWSAEAKILNGDLSVRCVLKPVFNVRGFDSARLALIKKIRAKELLDSPNPNFAANITPHFKQQTGRCKTRTDGLLEVEGNDGLADCMFHFNAQTGELISSEPYTWVD